MPRQKRYTTQKSQEIFPSRLRMLNDEKCTHEKESGVYLTREQIAKEIGKSRQSYAAYLDGSISPDFETLVSLARYFNVSVDWLLGLTDVRSPETNVQSICEYTGLSEKTVLAFNSFKSSTNKGLSDVLFSFLEFCCSETDAIDEFESIFSQIEYALLAIASTNYSSNNKTYVSAFDDRLPEFNYALAKHGLHLLLSDDVETFHRNAAIDHFRELLCLYLDKQSEVTTMSNESVSARDILSLMDEMLEDKNNGEGE